MKRLAFVLALLPVAMFADVNGEWKATVEATNTATHTKNLIGVYARLAQNGAQLTGTAMTKAAMLPIANATVSGPNVSFSIIEDKSPVAPRPTVFTLVQSGANLVGTVTLSDGEKLHVTMTPVSAAH